jgi:TonB family protein
MGRRDESVIASTRALLALTLPIALAGVTPQSDPFAGVLKPSDVTVRPQVRTKVVPQYIDGEINGSPGHLRVEMVIDAKGSVKAVRIAQPLSSTHEYDAKTLEAAKDWKFVPARKDDKAVPVATTMVVDVAMRPLPNANNRVGLGARVTIDGADDPFVDGTIAADDPDVVPKRVKFVPPHYPVAAMQAGQGGEVLIEAVVMPDGTVGRARIVRSVDIQIDKASLEAAKQQVYAPPTKGGQPVSVLVLMVMNFKMQ